MAVRMLRLFGRTRSLQKLASLSNRRSFPLLSSSGRDFSSSTACSSEEVELERLPNENTPWLMLKPEINESTGDKLERFYSPGENRVVKLNRSKCLKASNSAKCVASTMGGWLAYVDLNDCSVSLSNPYVNKVVQLPPVTTLPSVLDVKRDSETGDVISLKIAKAWLYNRDKFSWSEPKYETEKIVSEMIHYMALSSPESVAVALQGSARRLAYCTIGGGSSDFEWVGLQEDTNPGYAYGQVVYSCMTNKFYTLFRNTGIQVYDLENDRKRRSKIVYDFPTSSILVDIKEFSKKHHNPKVIVVDETFIRTHFYLVSLVRGDLLLVQRLIKNNTLLMDSDSDSDADSYSRTGVAPYETLHFEVFKVDFDKHELKRVDDLGNLSLFVGNNQGFSMSVDKVPGIRSNCIYFNDDQCDHVCVDWGHDNGIFDLSDNSCVPLGYEDHMKVPFTQDYSQYWVAPRLLFN